MANTLLMTGLILAGFAYKILTLLNSLFHMNGITVLVGFNSQSPSRRPSTPLSQYVKCEDVYSNLKILIESNIIGVKVIPINISGTPQTSLITSQSSHGLGRHIQSQEMEPFEIYLFDQLIFSRKNTGNWPDLKSMLAIIKKMIIEKAKSLGFGTPVETLTNSKPLQIDQPAYHKTNNTAVVNKRPAHTRPSYKLEELIMKNLATKSSLEFVESNSTTPNMRISATLNENASIKARLVKKCSAPVIKKEKFILQVASREKSLTPIRGESKEKHSKKKQDQPSWTANLNNIIQTINEENKQEKSVHPSKPFLVLTNSKPVISKKDTNPTPTPTPIPAEKIIKKKPRVFSQSNFRSRNSTNNNNTPQDNKDSSPDFATAAIKALRTDILESDLAPSRRIKTEGINQPKIYENFVAEGWAASTSPHDSFIEDIHKSRKGEHNNYFETQKSTKNSTFSEYRSSTISQKDGSPFSKKKKNKVPKNNNDDEIITFQQEPIREEDQMKSSPLKDFFVGPKKMIQSRTKSANVTMKKIKKIDETMQPLQIAKTISVTSILNKSGSENKTGNKFRIQLNKRQSIPEDLFSNMNNHFEPIGVNASPPRTVRSSGGSRPKSLDACFAPEISNFAQFQQIQGNAPVKKSKRIYRRSKVNIRRAPVPFEFKQNLFESELSFLK